jgi:hypothetical protein
MYLSSPCTSAACSRAMINKQAAPGCKLACSPPLIGSLGNAAGATLQCSPRRNAGNGGRPEARAARARSAGLQVACNGGDWLSSGALPDTVLFHTGITCTEREAASTPSANAARGKKQEEHGMHVLIKHGVRWLIL